MTVFVDTSAWIALLKPDDDFHPEAQRIWERLKSEASPLVTSDWVVVETVAYLTRSQGRRAAYARGATIMQSPRLRLVHADQTLFARAWERFGRATRDLSLVDCSSFCLMGEMGLTRAFTFDEDFAQEGFRAERG